MTGDDGEDAVSIVNELLRTVEQQARLGKWSFIEAESGNTVILVRSLQASQGANCTPGTELNLGVEVVNTYAQERFRGAALVSCDNLVLDGERNCGILQRWKKRPLQI